MKQVEDRSWFSAEGNVMPLIIDGGRVPPRWAERESLRSAGSVDSYRGADCVRIAFINNMPDSALEDTEIQFFDLLDAAAGDIPVLLKSPLAIRSSSGGTGTTAC